MGKYNSNGLAMPVASISKMTFNSQSLNFIAISDFSTGPGQGKFNAEVTYSETREFSTKYF
jgi:hypothetical protein